MSRLMVGEPAPGFKNLLGVDGKRYSLQDFKDKKVVAIIISCNHCPTVKAYESRMIGMQREYAKRGFSLIAINPNDSRLYPEDSYDNMVVRAREKGFNFPYLRDEDQGVARTYGAERTPEVFLLDGKRVLRYHGRIDDNIEDPKGVRVHYLRDAVEALLTGKAVHVAETTPVGCTVKWA